MSYPLIPKTDQEVREDPAPQVSGWQLPSGLSRWEKRELELVTQRRLLERLRYKGYVRRGTLGSVMQVMGDVGRKPWAQMILAALIYGWFVRYLL